MMACSARGMSWALLVGLSGADHNCAACDDDGHLMGPTIDFPGNDLLVTTVKDAAECCQACLISNACKMWVTSYPDEKQCWLKNGIHKSTRTEDQGRASGLTCGCDSTCPNHGMPDWNHRQQPSTLQDDGWGWSFILFLLLFCASYAAGGVAYNHKRKGMPLDQRALPHRDVWLGIAALVSDGCGFTREKYQQLRAGTTGSGLEPPLLPRPLAIQGAGGAVDGLLDAPESDVAEASTPQSPASAEDGWETVPSWIDRELVEQREAGVHSSMQRIKVEIGIEKAVE
eukprot:COSAG05_NODE_908_length_6643_cov_2.923441_1_plen_285_part_00